MELRYEPLLQIQRDLYALPRGMERFEAYIAAMTDADTGDMALPLVGMNPMGKDHIPELLDGWLELDAEAIATRQVEAIAPTLAAVAGDYRVGLVIVDDLHGGWTNRYTTEFSHLFENGPLYKRGWIVGMLWTSEQPAAAALRDELRTAVYRAALIGERGAPSTLRAMLEQEGTAMALAGRSEPSLDPEDLDYTGEVLEPLLDTTDHPTIMAALFGDEAARELGYRPLGVSTRAVRRRATDHACPTP